MRKYVVKENQIFFFNYCAGCFEVKKKSTGVKKMEDLVIL